MMQNVVATPATIIATFDDGKIILDRRLYEAKLGALAACNTVSEAVQLFEANKAYLMEHYQVNALIEPERC